jgi:hypothetical protein
MNSPTSKRIWLYLVISLLAAAPAGGFLFGLTPAIPILIPSDAWPMRS